jgi:transcriptional regulator with XRE-family HTH domain
MTGSQLKAWRVRMRLRVMDAADRLGVSRDTYGRLERQTRVPRYIQLACAALAYGLPPME